MKIYCVKICDIEEEMLRKLSLLVDIEKRYKIEKFVYKKDKIRSLIGEILIRTIVVKNLKLHNKNIRFNRNEYGKPYLKDYPELNFNISHSGDYILCAVDDKPIGIDVEEIKAIECEEIAKNFFTISEFEYIVNKDLKFKLNRFYEIWTLKESYVKCCGQGLSIPLKSFSIEIEQHEKIRVISKNKYEKHTLKLFDIELGYKAAVCSLNKEIPSNVIRLDQNSLINKYIKLNF